LSFSDFCAVWLAVTWWCTNIAFADESVLTIVLYASGMVSGAALLMKPSTWRYNLSSDDVGMGQIEEHDRSISCHIRRMQLRSMNELITIHAFVLNLCHHGSHDVWKLILWKILRVT
jgi:hypothetical protein